METSEQAIFKTLLYSDMFDFPLTKDELWKYLISSKKIDRNSFEKGLERLSLRGGTMKQSSKNLRQTLQIARTVDQGDCFPPVVARNDSGYYCLAGREAIIEKRIHNRSFLQKKRTIAKRAAYYLSYIPTIYFIGISGGLAAGNAAETDDIDLFIITKKRTLFMTRLFALGLLELMHLRRKREAPDASDKVCLNLLIDEEVLQWPKEKQDVYTAHEIVQLMPLFERQSIYSQFIANNDWILHFFPNVQFERVKMFSEQWESNYVTLQSLSLLLTCLPIECFSRFLQKLYLCKHRTNETIRNNFLAFHPNDYRSRSLTELNTRIKQYGLLTNS